MMIEEGTRCSVHCGVRDHPGRGSETGTALQVRRQWAGLGGVGAFVAAVSPLRLLSNFITTHHSEMASASPSSVIS